MARLVWYMGKTLDAEPVRMRRSPGFGLGGLPAEVMQKAREGDSEARKKMGLFRPGEPGFEERAKMIRNNNTECRTDPKVKRDNPAADDSISRMVDVYRWLIVRRLEGIRKSIQEIERRLAEAEPAELTDEFLNRILSDYHQAVG